MHVMLFNLSVYGWAREWGPMRRCIGWLAGLVLGLASAGCAIIIPPPSTVQPIDVVDVRPEGSIGPDTLSPTKWRKLTTAIDRETIQAVRRAQATFHFSITDCKGKFVWVEDLYVDGVSLNTLTSLADAEFASF